MYSELEIVTDIVGNYFEEEDMYLRVNRNNLSRIESNVSRYFYEKEADVIRSIIKEVFYISVKDMLRDLGIALRYVFSHLLTHKPIVLTHSVTSECNCRCKICDCWRKKHSSDEMDTREIFRMLD